MEWLFKSFGRGDLPRESGTSNKSRIEHVALTTLHKRQDVGPRKTPERCSRRHLYRGCLFVSICLTLGVNRYVQP
jgi:hypothetical protein